MTICGKLFYKTRAQVLMMLYFALFPEAWGHATGRSQLHRRRGLVRSLARGFLALFTTTHVMRDGHPIVHVFHDADDHGWQFHWAGEKSMADAMLVVLEEIYFRDPTVAEVVDLPPGGSHQDRTLDPLESGRRMNERCLILRIGSNNQIPFFDSANCGITNSARDNQSIEE